jgi:hypothetical protein
MEVLAIIAVIEKIVTVVSAVSAAAPAAVETMQAGARAYDLIKRITSKDPEHVTKAELDAYIAESEALEADILKPIAPPED